MSINYFISAYLRALLKHQRLLLSVFLIFQLALPSAFAHEWHNFKDQATRPTAGDLLGKAAIPPENPFQATCADPHMENLINLGPELISELEYAYPNSIWAPLGRDSSLVGDLLEAFYIKLGQNGRVVRLNASSSSFSSATPEMILGFLETAGLVDSKGIPIKNFVIIDPTSWRTESQSRRLISAVYNAIPKAKQRDYLPKVNVVALGLSPTLITPSLNMHTFLSGVSIDSYGPSQIVSVQGSPAYLPSCSGSEVAWHDKFKPFAKDGSGKVVAEPGTKFSNFTEHVLWEMYEIIKKAQSDEFVKKVMEVSSVTYQKPLGFTLKSPIYKAALEVVEKNPEKLSELNEASLDWFTQQPITGFTDSDPTLLWLSLLAGSKEKYADATTVMQRLSQKLLSSEPSNQTKELLNMLYLMEPTSNSVLKGHIQAHFNSWTGSYSELSLLLAKFSSLFPSSVEEYVGNFRSSEEKQLALKQDFLKIVSFPLEKQSIGQLIQLLASQEDSKALVSLFLMSSPSPAHFLQVIGSIPSTVAYRESLILEHLDIFIAHSPNAQQTNQLISFVALNGSSHQSIAEKAIGAMTNSQDYLALDRPKGKGLNPSYKLADKKFKKEHRELRAFGGTCFGLWCASY